MRSPAISLDLLLHGAWYALEQCGLLLRDAVDLYEEAGNSTAASVALLAREELGKFFILLRMWRSALKGQSPTVDSVRRACMYHEEKQREGQGGIAIPVKAGTKFAALVQKARLDPANPDGASARSELKRIIMKRSKAQPSARTKLREQGFYVDLNEAGTNWELPRDMAREVAYQCIEEAVGDYSVTLNNFSVEALNHEEPQLAWLAGWYVLPQPKWLSVP